jgi:hypothetical protein
LDRIISAPRSVSTIPVIAAAGERSEKSSTRTIPLSGPAMAGLRKRGINGDAGNFSEGHSAAIAQKQIDALLLPSCAGSAS